MIQFSHFTDKKICSLQVWEEGRKALKCMSFKQICIPPPQKKKKGWKVDEVQQAHIMHKHM